MAKFRGAILECKTCGKLFKVPPVRKDTAKYCSPACSGAGKSVERTQPRVAIVCKMCGVTFFERQCHAGRRTYCSNECRNSSDEYRQSISARTTGEGNGTWKGGYTTHADGYIYELCSEHPFSKHCYVFQHRLVVERHLRENHPGSKFLVKFGNQLYLDPTISVHHINTDRTDNRIENLQAMTAGDHQRLHNALRRQKEKGE